jgi:hypothetical protein
MIFKSVMNISLFSTPEVIVCFIVAHGGVSCGLHFILCCCSIRSKYAAIWKHSSHCPRKKASGLWCVLGDIQNEVSIQFRIRNIVVYQRDAYCLRLGPA